MDSRTLVALVLGLGLAFLQVAECEHLNSSSLEQFDGEDTQNVSNTTDIPDDVAMAPRANHSMPEILSWKEIKQRRMRHRNRVQAQLRLQRIREQIIAKLGLTAPPNITRPRLSEAEKLKMTRMLAMTVQQNTPQTPLLNPEEYFAKRSQSYKTSCRLPIHTEEELWNVPQSLNLYFDISTPEETQTKVMSSTLKLYKTRRSQDDDCNCDDSPSGGGRPRRSHGGRGTGRASVDGSLDNVDQLRISAYQYIRPVKHYKRVKRKMKKLVDSVMVPEDFEGWLRFSIRPTVQNWARNPNKNFGIEIHVENSLQTKLRAQSYIKTYNCSQETNDTRPIPIPGIPLAMGTTSDNSSVTFIEGYSTYPTLDVSTIEIPLQSRHLFHGRLKRAPPAEDACRLDNITISFEADLNLPRVLAPTRFITGVCAGTCTTLGSTDEAFSQNRCCGPTKFQPLSMVYDDGETISFGTIPNYIVTACGCGP